MNGYFRYFFTYRLLYFRHRTDSGNGACKYSNKAENASSDDELLSVCKQFESYLLEQVFKHMDKTVIRNGDDSKDAATENLVDFFKGETIQELAKQSTEKDGLGLAQQLYEQMKRNYNIE